MLESLYHVTLGSLSAILTDSGNVAQIGEDSSGLKLDILRLCSSPANLTLNWVHLSRVEVSGKS